MNIMKKYITTIITGAFALTFVALSFSANQVEGATINGSNAVINSVIRPPVTPPPAAAPVSAPAIAAVAPPAPAEYVLQKAARN